MRTIGKRSAFLLAFVLAFAAGLVFFLYEYVVDGADWAMQPYNNHLTAGTTALVNGKVTDRNGTVLLNVENGQRTYAESEEMREATLHVVGDEGGNISTGVQSAFKSQLTGYNLLTGLADLHTEKSGGDIQLTIDADLNQLAYEDFAGRDGAAILTNWKTGEILCMVSMPTFDPANPPSDIETNDAYTGVYVNKVLSGQLTPGSVFKLFTTAAAIENLPDLDSMTFHCTGSETFNGNEVTDVSAHGTLSFRDALAHSCNVAFAELAVQIGADKMTSTVQSMGLLDPFEIDSIQVAAGNYDVAGASEDRLAWSGVGQDKDLVNPAYMVRLMGAIANGGMPEKLHFIQNATGDLGVGGTFGQTEDDERLLSESTANRLRDYMRYNVEGYYGDSTFPGISQVCAKTGTGELGGEHNNNGWMVAFSLDESTPYAVAVVVEHTPEYGSQSAGVIAKDLLAAAAQKGA